MLLGLRTWSSVASHPRSSFKAKAGTHQCSACQTLGKGVPTGTRKASQWWGAWSFRGLNLTGGLWIRGWHYQQGVNIATWLGMSKRHQPNLTGHCQDELSACSGISLYITNHSFTSPSHRDSISFCKIKGNPAWRFLSSPEGSTSGWICSNFTSLTSWMGTDSWETIQENQKNYGSLQTISTKV